MPTPLNQVTGIGPKTAAYLHGRNIDSAEALLRAGAAILAGAPGFGEARANTVMEAVRALLDGTLSQTVNPVSKGKKKDADKKKKGDKRKKGEKAGKKVKKDSDKKKKKKKKDKKDKKKKK